jgi:tRNA (cmo5U34)-methyltransferase
MKDFDRDEAARYDHQMPMRVPLYLELQHLASTLLESLLPSSAQVLVVGAGSGTEIITMARRNPGWQFAAVEPSASMQHLAREKIAQAGLLERVHFHGCPVEDMRHEHRWDAAVALLVSHFVPDDGSKARFFGAISDCLTSKAPLISLDLMRMESSGDSSLRSAWARWASSHGATPQEVASMMERARAVFYPLTESRFEALLREQGFHVAGRFAQALEFGGYLCFKVGAHEQVQ